VGAVVVMKSKRRQQLATWLMPQATLWILTMTSVRSCLRKTRKISSACQLAASWLSVAFRMSLLRRRLESLNRTIPMMETKRVKTLSDRKKAKIVRIVRDADGEDAGGVVEAAKIPAIPFVRKSSRSPARDVRRRMKTTSTKMMTIWKLTMWI